MKRLIIHMICLIIIASYTLIVDTNESCAGVGVKPTIIETVVSTGEVKKGAYTVVNSDPKPIHVKVEIEDWLEKRTGESSIPVEDWLTITPMELDIESGGMKQVEYKIEIPRGADSELVAMVFFSAAVPMEGAFDITSRFGVSIYAAIEEGMELECKINDLSVRRNITEKKEGGRIDKGIIFVVDVANDGNVHLRPTGFIEVIGPGGKKYRVGIERGFPVYPGSKLDYAIHWKRTDIPSGDYEATINLDYGKIYNVDAKLKRKVTFSVNEDGSVSGVKK